MDNEDRGLAVVFSSILFFAVPVVVCIGILFGWLYVWASVPVIFLAVLFCDLAIIRMLRRGRHILTVSIPESLAEHSAEVKVRVGDGKDHPGEKVAVRVDVSNPGWDRAIPK